MKDLKVIVGALEEALLNPKIQPDARNGIEGRLRRFRAMRNRRQNNRDLSRATASSAKSRKMTAEKMYRKVTPLILRMGGEGLTYKEIAAVLESRGITSAKGSPFSEAWIGTLYRRATHADGGNPTR